MSCLTFGMPRGLIYSLVKHTTVRLGSKTLAKARREIYLVGRKSEERRISFKPLGISERFRTFVCEALCYSCVEACIFRPFPRVFTLSLRVCVCVYVCTEVSTGKKTGKEKRTRTRDCRGGCGEAPSHPCLPLFRGELRVCIPNERVGWRSALHNQQTLTSKEPKGASSSHGWTCRTNSMSSHNTSSSSSYATLHVRQV